MYSKPDVCASLTTSRLFGLGDLPRSVLERSSDHYLLEDMTLGHVSLLPLCMLLLMSRKPYFLELVAVGVQSLGPPFWWIWGAGTQGTPWHISEPSQEPSLFGNKKFGKTCTAFFLHMKLKADIVSFVFNSEALVVFWSKKKRTKVPHDKIMRVHKLAEVLVSK